MRSLLAVLLAFVFLAPESGAAQSGTAVAPAVGDSIPAAAAPAAKKKGLFGKVKGLAKNKIVKTVAKAALCTVVPGGQVIAGALEAAETKNVAGAASAVATGGGSCMPGMAGMAGAGAGAAGIGAAGVGALGAGVSGGGVPGQPTTGMPGMAMSPEQMKQMQEQYGKMGIDPAQMAAMQQMMAQMPPGGTGMPAGAAMPAGAGMPPPGATGMPPDATEIAGEASGKAIEMSPDFPKDLKKGRTVIRNVDWVPGAADVSPASSEAFGRAMAKVAAAMKQAGGSYRLDLYMDEQSANIVVRKLGAQRLSAVQAAVLKDGTTKHPQVLLQIGQAKKDKDPRLEIVKLK